MNNLENTFGFIWYQSSNPWVPLFDGPSPCVLKVRNQVLTAYWLTTSEIAQPITLCIIREISRRYLQPIFL